MYTNLYDMTFYKTLRSISRLRFGKKQALLVYRGILSKH